MAKHAHDFAPLDGFLAVLPTLPRALLAVLTSRLIDAMDEIDGDPDDMQANGDELDGNPAEDDFWPHIEALPMPGCPFSDGMEPEEDFGAEEAGEPEGWIWPAIADRDAARDQLKRIRLTRCDRKKELWCEPSIPTRRQLLTRKRGVPLRSRA